jgi:hypothetical protein
MTANTTNWKETYAYVQGLQALLHGYPVVRNSLQRWGMVRKPQGQVDVPETALYHARVPGTSADKYGSSISDDILYSAAWFDVSTDPLVVTVPDAGERYLGVQLMEMYSDIFGYIGLRATGNKAGNHLIVGPQWNQPKPVGIGNVYRSPTPTGMILLRIDFDDRAELASANALQDEVHITPLSYWSVGREFVPGKRDVLDPVLPGTDPLWFFRTLNRAMTENPPTPDHAALLPGWRSVGIGPGMPDDLSTLDASFQKGLARAQAEGLSMLRECAQSGFGTTVVNQWAYGQANWGRTALDFDYLTRAASQSLAGMQEHHVEEVVKLRTHRDAQGIALNGNTGNYTIRFGSQDIPQARAFWAVTVYDEKYDLSANPIDRYSLGSHNKDLHFEADGSLTFYLQHQPPGDPALHANWLPVPDAAFNLFMRAYLPGQALIDQTYVPPAVVRVAD